MVILFNHTKNALMLTKERISVTLSAQVKNELDNIVPKNNRSQFVEQAIADALKSRHHKLFFELIDAIDPVSVDQDSVELVSQIREKGIGRVISHEKD